MVVLERIVTLTGDQSCTEGTHDTGDVRADCLAAGDLFKTAENRIVVEGSALYDHMFSEVVRHW